MSETTRHILIWIIRSISISSLVVGSGYILKKRKLPTGALYWFWAYSILWLWQIPSGAFIPTDTNAQAYFVDQFWQVAAVSFAHFLFSYAGEAKSYLPLRRPDPKELGKYLIIAIVPGVLMMLSVRAPGTSHHILEALREGGATAGTYLLGMCFVAPICEEILFRGVLLREKSLHWRMTLQGIPVFFSSIVFAWLHANFWSAVILSLIGVALRRKFDSLVASIAFHMVWNFGLAMGVYGALYMMENFT
jgi:membrane protease YdiL (CAAX protease family)